MPALERLSPPDFYVRLDRLRDEWPDDVERNGARVAKLRRLFEHLPSRYYEEAAPLLKFLALHIDYDLEVVAPTIVNLTLLVSTWNAGRPPVLECEVCGVELRGHPALRRHYETVHPDVELERAAIA